jgi:hypothetical protein
MTHDIADPLPAPPRPLNSRARKRSWAEAPVRAWMGASLFLAVLLAYLIAQNIHDAILDRRLIAQGVPTTAKIVDIAGDGDPRKAVAMHGATDDRTVHLSYTDQHGNAVESASRPIENPKFEGRHPGQTIEIRYDPERPESWTDRTEPLPWAARLTIVWMLLPLLIIALIMLVVRRAQVLTIWRDGVEANGTVVDLRQSAIAPRSRVVRVTLKDSEDRRIFSTFFPNAAGALQKGDELLLLTSPGNRSRVIAAELYEELNR